MNSGIAAACAAQRTALTSRRSRDQITVFYNDKMRILMIATMATWDILRMEDLPPEINAMACGGGVDVSVDRRSATSRAGAETPGSRVVLRLGLRVRGRLRVEFMVDRDNDVCFGYALVGATCARGFSSDDAGTQYARGNQCWEGGVWLEGAPWCDIPPSVPAALLFDMDEGTVGYEVKGRHVGTLFRGLRGLAIVPVFFIDDAGRSATRLTITRLRSGAGAG